MEKKQAVVCVIAGILGLLSAVLAFAAEATKNRASEVTIRFKGGCTYPKSPSVYLGMASAVAVALAQALINFAAGCICCRSRNLPNPDLPLISFIISWITFIIAFLLLLTGSALNDQGRLDKKIGNGCYVLKPGVFSGGASLSLASVSLGIIYYMGMAKAASPPPLPLPLPLATPFDPPRNRGIALGQPQIPPRMTEQPVFVHEDTYNRLRIP